MSIRGEGTDEGLTAGVLVAVSFGRVLGAQGTLQATVLRVQARQCPKDGPGRREGGKVV